MALINAFLLPGVLLFGVPILIHILMRRRVKEMDWAAMQFLLEIIEEQKKRITIEELLLLVLRTLMIFLLAWAVVRPALMNEEGRALFGGGADVLLVVDGTYSMATRQSADSRFERAKKTAIELLDSLPPSSRVALLIASESPDPVVREFSVDHDLLRETIKGLTVQHHAGDTTRTFSALEGILKQSDRPLRKVYYISDFQPDEWQAPTEAARTALKQITQQAKVTFIPVLDDQTENTGATELKLPTRIVRTGARTQFTFRVTNHGKDPAEAVPVDLLVNGEVIDSQTINLLPGQTQTQRVPYVATEPGWHEAVLRIRHDAVETDNACYLPMLAADAVPVLVVEDPVTEAGKVAGGDLLELLLNPYPQRSRDERAVFTFSRITSADLLAEPLESYALVFLVDVPGLTRADATHLEEYVASGGGLMMFVGERARPEFYNNSLYRDGAGLLPWPLQETPLRQDDADTPLLFQPRHPDHPVWADLLDDGTGYFERVFVFAAHAFTAGASDRVLALADARRKENDPPAPVMLDIRYGRGHAIAVGSSADLSMNDLAIRPAWLAAVNQAAQYLLTFREGKRVVRVGERADRYVDFQHSQATYRVTFPRGESVGISPLLEENLHKNAAGNPATGDREQEVYRLTLPDLSQAGFYRVVNESNPADAFRVAANIDPREGAIACMLPTQLHETYGPQDVKVVGAESDETADLNAGALEFAPLLLILMLLCWLGENLLACRISRR